MKCFRDRLPDSTDISGLTALEDTAMKETRWAF
jgi:hypothetical protein